MARYVEALPGLLSYPRYPTLPSLTSHVTYRRHLPPSPAAVTYRRHPPPTSLAGLGQLRSQLTDLSFKVPLATLEQPVASLTQAFANLQSSSKSQILQYFHNTWALTDILFSSLRSDAIFYTIPDPLRRPLIFYFGHSAALYANKLGLAGLITNPNTELSRVLETGVDEMPWDDMDQMQHPDYPWPTIAQVQHFRDAVFQRVEAAIRHDMPDPRVTPITAESPWWVLFMGFEHERIHLETSSVLIRQLPIDAVQRPAQWTYAPSHAGSPADAPAPKMLDVASCTVVLGKPASFPTFGWDNEYGERTVHVPSFAAGKFMVTNAEFLPFVLAGGYHEKRWWVSAAGDDEGWRWARQRNATHPSFWVATADMPEYHGGKPAWPYQKDDGHARAGSGSHFKLRAMFDIIAMPWDWPVEVNVHEAHAFMAWRGAQDGVAYRLGTEAEHHVLRADPSPWPADAFYRAAPQDPGSPSCYTPYDIMQQQRAPGNVNLRYGSPSPVGMFPASATGFHDTHGNVWEWVEDHFGPLPGFAIHPAYDDFSTPTFDGFHNVILGGSWISTGDQASNFARYAFRRHFFQHAGFRMVRVSQHEAWPGCHTAANLWEGKSEMARALASTMAPPARSLAALASLPSAMSASVETAAGPALCAGLQYPAALAAWIAGVVPASAGALKVLHLGAGCGAGSYALVSALCAERTAVVALESKEPLVRDARVLQHHGQLEYEHISEGVLGDTVLATCAEPSAVRAKVQLELGDVNDLLAAVLDEPTQGGAGGTPSTGVAAAHAEAPYDVVLVDSLLHRLPRPADMLRALPLLVKPGGIAVVACSNDWQPAHTARNSWLGGFCMSGEEFPTLRMLQMGLKSTFVPAGNTDLPKLSVVCARRMVLDIMQVSAWRRSDLCCSSVSDVGDITPGASAEEVCGVSAS